MEELLCLGPGHTELPASAVLVHWVLPDRLDATEEDMHGVAHVDAVPRVIVVYPIEGRDVRDVLVEDRKSGFVVGRLGVLVVPDGPMVLEWRRTECHEASLEESLP